MAKVLGESIGKMEEIDRDGGSGWTGPVMRMRIVVDISKPLQRVAKLRATDGRVVWCPIQYEKLPDVCFNCGIIGHSHSSKRLWMRQWAWMAIAMGLAESCGLEKASAVWGRG